MRADRPPATGPATRGAARHVLLAVAMGATFAGACGQQDEVCGPEGAPAAGIDITTDRGVVTFGQFTSSVNNDCTPPDGTAISITVDGVQVSPAPAGLAPHLTLCLPRPDRLAEFGGQPIALGLDDTANVRLVDASGEQNGCSFALERSAAPPASAAFSGYCDGGLDPAGFALELSGSLSLTRACPDAETLTGSVSGTAAVSAI